MKVDTLKDLEKLVKLCRKTGVETITVDGITIELGDVPESKSLTRNAAPTTDKIQIEPTYTEEELLTWSSAPHG